MRPMWRVTGVAVAMAIVAAGGAAPASAQVPAGIITVDPLGTFDQQGLATISGTYQCEETEAFTSITGNLVQPVGRLAPVRGDFVVADAPCTGEVEVWTATVQGAGQFRGGRATASAAVVACAEQCVVIAETTESVRLTG